MNIQAVDIQELDFTYTNPYHKCFSGLNLQINKGDRFGLFGPNGAGKTTLMSCMTGLLSFNSGSIHLLGIDLKKNPKEVKKLIGFVPQDLAFYQELSPKENFEYFGALSGMDKQSIKTRSLELLDILGLTEMKDKAVHTFSGGMKRKVNLAIGVMHNPSLLFLDEPTVGVDIQTRHIIINFLKELNAAGTTLVYTSHQLSEAQELCTNIALIYEGKIIEHDTLENLFQKHKEKSLEGLFIKLTGKNYQEVDV
ncbi:ABC transporter ATP-binding protein [Aurantibacillus circumpalustris]|uniref:ABC transporter ATP-binding protein n=1 Tax=Aurantibacillus circumpalustris TaxID=3036359 RepID=UPI00295BB952|nr:ABC transporter ATP-binding protein [Aurantibacillus circumpalustris]